MSNFFLLLFILSVTGNHKWAFSVFYCPGPILQKHKKLLPTVVYFIVIDLILLFISCFSVVFFSQ